MKFNNVVQQEHECVYGVILGDTWVENGTKDRGTEITETLIGGNIDGPTYRGSDGRVHLGLLETYFDRRRRLATHYKYCPYCGKKLNFRKIKQLAIDSELV